MTLSARSLKMALLVVAGVALGMPSPALAQQQAANIIKALNQASDKQTNLLREQIKQLGGSVDKASEDIQSGMIKNFTEQQKEDLKVTAESGADLVEVMGAIPQALVVDHVLVSDLMNARLRELNLVPPNNQGVAKASYMVNPGEGAINLNAQMFDIMMRFFCDRKADSGRLATFKTNRGVGCGTADAGETLDTKMAAAGTGGGAWDANTIRDDVAGLPTKPGNLFFNPVTFPQGAVQGATGMSNVSPVTELYYGAYAQALRFLVGTPPDTANIAGYDTLAGQQAYIKNQGENARKMLATYPFAVLFAERVGTIGREASQIGKGGYDPIEALANIITDRFGTETGDPIIAMRINELRSRKSVSMAEWMDIMMYQVPMSPGYLERINNMTNRSELQREKIWLTAMQTAVNYQRNRWLEIMMALEAAGKKG